MPRPKEKPSDMINCSFGRGLVHSFGFKCRPLSQWIKRGKDDQATTLKKNPPDTAWPKATGGNLKKKTRNTMTTTTTV